MKRAAHVHIAAALALLLWGGCAADTPTQAAGDGDGVVAAMVAGSVGHQSNGFAAMLDDAVAVAAGQKIASDSVIEAVRAVPAAERDALAGNAESLLLVRREIHDDFASEWHLTYKRIVASPTEDMTEGLQNVGSEPVVIEARSDGVFRNVQQTMQGESVGRFSIDRPEDATLPTGLRGLYEYNGSAIFHGSMDEQYSAVRITLNWNRLLVMPKVGGGYRSIIGQADASISANGPQGTISKNARLVFDGTDRATLTISGRTFVVDVNAADLMGRK